MCAFLILNMHFRIYLTMDVLLLRFNVNVIHLISRFCLHSTSMRSCASTCSSAYDYNGCLAWYNVLLIPLSTQTWNTVITCSTVMLQCYRRQAVPMKQAKIRPSVTLYSLDRSLPHLVWLITSVTPTHMPILVKLVQWGIPRK